eukprot:tig00021348_g20542.t1
MSGGDGALMSGWPNSSAAYKLPGAVVVDVKRGRDIPAATRAPTASMSSALKWTIVGITMLFILGLAAVLLYFLVFDKIAQGANLKQPTAAYFPPELLNYSSMYGYNGELELIRKNDFKRLADSNSVYLDHAGSALYPESELPAVMMDMQKHVFGNPHSQSSSGYCTEDRLQASRTSVLEFFRTNPSIYSVIFTMGATGALKTVGEAFPWGPGGMFVYTMENHNSGSNFTALTYVEIVERLNMGINVNDPTSTTYHLFAFPGESNFNGAKFDLEIINRVRKYGIPPWRGRWFVLLDAAKYTATSLLDLTKYPSDFVAVSFYKVFGYPTGVGALVVRTELGGLLKKGYWGGGTINGALAGSRFQVFRQSLSERFEDGTTNFLSIMYLKNGFDRMVKLGMDRVQSHTAVLAMWTVQQLEALRHSSKNGTAAPGAIVYTTWQNRSGGLEAFMKTQGSVVTFNVLLPDGRYYSHLEVERLAGMDNISLRSGCFCNPGACQLYLGLTDEEIMTRAKAGESCSLSAMEPVKRPTGAVRASFGYESNFEDAVALISFIKKHFIK